MLLYNTTYKYDVYIFSTKNYEHNLTKTYFYGIYVENVCQFGLIINFTIRKLSDDDNLINDVFQIVL